MTERMVIHKRATIGKEGEKVKHIWRKVVSYERYSPTNNPHPSYPCSLIIKLECGHELPHKYSQGVPKKMACLFCADKVG